MGTTQLRFQHIESQKPLKSSWRRRWSLSQTLHSSGRSLNCLLTARGGFSWRIEFLPYSSTRSNLRWRSRTRDSSRRRTMVEVKTQQKRPSVCRNLSILVRKIESMEASLRSLMLKTMRYSTRITIHTTLMRALVRCTRTSLRRWTSLRRAKISRPGCERTPR